ncbi:MAG TPA: 6-phosphogluconolactonase [Thermoanaerobaculia bacterium]|nr:6-phosphogluconolactonase [Thermoanaerobaculia bacterium]
MREVLAFATADDVADAAAFLFVNLAVQAVRDRGTFYVALAGGTTPLSCYRLLSAPPISSRVDWERTQVFFGDERCVPEGQPDRNDQNAAAALLDHVPIPSKNIHRVPVAEPDAAERYESELRGAFSGIPRFDLVFLGLGADGHTVSLFPGHASLEETQRLVLRIDNSPKPPPSRVTFTLPLLNAARHVALLATGKDKADALARVLAEDEALPAARVRPAPGMLTILADAAAVSHSRNPPAQPAAGLSR